MARLREPTAEQMRQQLRLTKMSAGIYPRRPRCYECGGEIPEGEPEISGQHCPMHMCQRCLSEKLFDSGDSLQCYNGEGEGDE